MKRILLWCLCAFSSAGAYADIPQEQILLTVTDSTFVAGDAVWFRATLADGSGHPLEDFSKYIYVELIDPFGEVRERVKIKEKDGVFAGYVPLDRELPEGTYTLAAYTTYMRNRGAEYFYRQPLDVRSIYSYKYKIVPEFAGNKLTVRLQEAKSGKPVKSENLTLYDSEGTIFDAGRKKSDYTFKIPAKDGTVKVKFDNFEKFIAVPPRIESVGVECFPEGGSLIAGVSNAVAVRATDPDGRPMSVEGEIVGSSGDKIADFAADSAGMALVYMYPAAGSKYSAKVGKRSFALPRVETEKTSLTVVRRGDALIVDLLGRCPQGVAFEVNVGGITEYYDTVPDFPLSISLTKLPAGIAELTLLSPEGEVISGRAFDNSADGGLSDAQMIARKPESRTTDRFPVEIGGEISGTVRSYWRGKPVSDAQVTIASHETRIAMTAVTDKAGRFKFNGIDWPDGSTFIIRAVNSKGEIEPNFTVDADTFPVVSPLPMPVELNDPEPVEYDPVMHSGITLREITVTATRSPEKALEMLYQGMGARVIDQKYLALRGITSYEEAIRAIPAVRLVNGRVVSSRGATSIAASGLPQVEFCVGGVAWSSPGAGESDSADGMGPSASDAPHGAPLMSDKDGMPTTAGTGSRGSGVNVTFLSQEVPQIEEFAGMYPFHMVESITYMPPAVAMLYSNTAAHSGGILMVTLKDSAKYSLPENERVQIHRPLGYQK